MAHLTQMIVDIAIDLTRKGSSASQLDIGDALASLYRFEIRVISCPRNLVQTDKDFKEFPVLG